MKILRHGPGCCCTQGKVVVHQTDHTMLVESLLFNNLPGPLADFYKHSVTPAVGEQAQVALCVLSCQTPVTGWLGQLWSLRAGILLTSCQGTAATCLGLPSLLILEVV